MSGEEVQPTADQLPEESPGDGERVEEESQDLDFYLQTIEELRRERDEFYDLLLRKQAEFENYRKRVSREGEETRLAAQADVLRQLLPVLDSCEKALDSLTEAEAAGEMRAYQEGFELLLKSLRSVLDRFGVEEVPGLGAPFDPNLHEAVHSEASEERTDGEILEEYRKGYSIKGRLLRPSQVKVAVKPQGEPSEKQ